MNRLLILLISLLFLVNTALAALPNTTVQDVPNLNRFDVMYIPNQGQWPEEVLYGGRATNADVYFTQHDVRFYVHGAEGQGHWVRVYPEGVDLSQVTVTHEIARSTRFNMYVGDDPTRWMEDVPTYQKIRYQDVYPGIDWVFRSHAGQVIYDLEVAVQVDPSVIELTIEGVETATVNEAGVMVMSLPDGSPFYQQAPFIFQPSDSEIVPVQGRFTVTRMTQPTQMAADGQEAGSATSVSPAALQGEVVDQMTPQSASKVSFSFALEPHDPDLALVIDPTFSTFVGGSGEEQVSSMQILGNGDIIVVGSTNSTLASLKALFGDPDMAPVRDEGNLGRRSLLVYRLQSDGTDVDYITVLGGAADDHAYASVLGGTPSGLYITGRTSSANFPVTPNGIQPTLPGGRGQSAFIARLNQSNGRLGFATYFGGSAADVGKAIGLEDGGPNRIIYVAGETASNDLATRSALPGMSRYPGGGTSLFLMAVIEDTSNSPSPPTLTIRSLTYFGGSGVDTVSAMHVTNEGDVFLAGSTSSTDFETTQRVVQGAQGGGVDGYFTRFVPGLQAVVYSTYLGGSGTDIIHDFVISDDGYDGSGHIYLVGQTNSENFPVVNPVQEQMAGGVDAFVAKLDVSGRFLRFATYLGGPLDDLARSVAIAKNPADQTLEDIYASNADRRYIYIAGETRSPNFPIMHPRPFQGFHSGGTDGFVVKMSPYGTHEAYSTFFGGLANDSIMQIKADSGAANKVYLSGVTATRSKDDGFPIHPADSAFQTVPNSRGIDSFVARLDGLKYDSMTPRLILQYRGDDFPETRDDPDWLDDTHPKITFDLWLKVPQDSPGVSAFSTRILYDSDILTPRHVLVDGVLVQGDDDQSGSLDEFGWSFEWFPPFDGSMPMFNQRVEHTSGRFILVTWQESSSLDPIRDPNNPGAEVVRIGQLVFGANNVSRLAQYDEQAYEAFPADLRPSLPVMLRFDRQTSMTDLIGRTIVPVSTVPGGVVFARPCNRLTGDRDCSGTVTLSEVVRAARELVDDFSGTNWVDRPYYLRLRWTSTLGGEDSTEDAVDDIPPIMARIVTNHIENFTEPPVPWQRMQPRNANEAGSAQITLGEAVPGYPSGLRSDIQFATQGQRVSTVALDIFYDPDNISELSVQRGVAAQAADKTVVYGRPEPGHLRVIVYGVNYNLINDGVLATLNYTVHGSLAGTSLQVRAGAATPDAVAVAVDSGNGLVFGETELRFVAQQYQDFLNRDADTSGVQHWANVLLSGHRSQAEVVDLFFSSEEFQSLVAPLARLYFAYFDRIPDYDGLMFWVDSHRQGTPLGAVSAAFAESSEFVDTYGALDDAGFLERVYLNVLGRMPDEAGYEHWLERMQAGLGRGDMMIQLSESAEYRAGIDSTVQVSMMYLSMLRRAPDAQGLDYWVGQLTNGGSVLGLIDGFIGSDEYAQRLR